MINVPSAILEEAQNTSSVQPKAVLILWSEEGAEDRIIGKYRMGGNNDAAAVGDTNISVDSQGYMTLSAGNSVAIPPVTPNYTWTRQTYWDVFVKDIYTIIYA